MKGLFFMWIYQHIRCVKVLMCCFITLYTVNNSFAQYYSWEDFVERISMDQSIDDNYLTPLLEDLSELHEHPFNINTITKENLKQLPFLSPEDIEEILAYIYRYGPMKSLGELMLIEKLDYQTRQFLTLFIYVGEPDNEKEKLNLKEVFKNGRHELSTRLDVPLYQRDGYKIPSEEELLKNPNKVYLGNSLYHNIRYSFKYQNKLFFGLTTEKDQGEPFGSYGNKGYDTYSFHFLLKDCGFLKTLALGDYRLKFGEGLVVNTDYHFGKSTMLSLTPEHNTIKKYSSTSETSFFRGVAATFQYKKLDISAFYSYLPMDATLRKDGTISSIKTDGLHRTLLELSKKHNTVEQSAGGDITWHDKYFSVGITSLYQHFNRPFSTGTESYRLYYPSGKDFFNISTHYDVRYKNFYFSGETAYNNTYNGWATMNKGVYRFHQNYSLVALQRLYTYQYVGLRANAFSEGGTVKNESGFYLGMEASPMNELKLFAYVDYFYFPWVKFATPHTSDGVEGTLQADYIFSKKCNVSAHYQIKKKERYGEPYLYNKLKLQCQYFPMKTLEIRLSTRCTTVRDQQHQRVKGYMGNAILKWHEKKDRIKLALSYAYFNSEDYKAPMSFYEPSLLYTYSFMTMYGQGMRVASVAEWNISKHFMLMLKYGITAYTDRTEIGEGLQRIGSRYKNDLSFLLKCKF